MSRGLDFNFHNLIGVHVESQDPKMNDFYLQEFRNAVGSMELLTSEVRLRWDRRATFERIPAGYQFHTHKMLARWAYRISFNQGCVEIHAMGNEVAIPMVHHMLVHPAMRYLSSFSDVLMLHGSAVVKNGRSLIFTGKGGTGKTTTSSLLLQYGGPEWHLHADDYLFLGPKFQTMGYLTRSHLYLDILRWIPELKKVLTPWERLKLEFFGRLRSLSGDGLKWPIRLSIDRLWPNHNWAATAELSAVLLLRRAGIEETSLTPIEFDGEFIEEILEMNFTEARHFCALLERAVETGLPEDWLLDWRRREKRLLQENLSSVPIYWLNLPLTSDVDQIGLELVDHLTQLLERGDESS